MLSNIMNRGNKVKIRGNVTSVSGILAPFEAMKLGLEAASEQWEDEAERQTLLAAEITGAAKDSKQEAARATKALGVLEQLVG